MSVLRKELVNQTSCSIWKYINEVYKIDVDIEDISEIVDANIGFSVDVVYELEETNE